MAEVDYHEAYYYMEKYSNLRTPQVKDVNSEKPKIKQFERKIDTNLSKDAEDYLRNKLELRK